MFREALLAARNEVSEEELQKTISELHEWVKGADLTLMGEDEFEEKYGADERSS